MTFRIGQESICAYFFKFSCNGNSFIVNNSYLTVSFLPYRKFLYIKEYCYNFALSKGKRLSAAKLNKFIESTKL